MPELRDKIAELEGRLAELEAFFDVDGLREEAEELGCRAGSSSWPGSG